MLFCTGERLQIDQAADAEASWREAIAHAPAACVAQLHGLAQRLADTGRLRSPDQFNTEGNGFYAIKARCGLRAYGWFHSTRRGVFMISHFTHKTWQKLAKEDRQRMEKNRKALDPTYQA